MIAKQRKMIMKLKKNIMQCNVSNKEINRIKKLKKGKKHIVINKK
jgi:hypothetical protein